MGIQNFLSFFRKIIDKSEARVFNLLGKWYTHSRQHDGTQEFVLIFRNLLGGSSQSQGTDLGSTSSISACLTTAESQPPRAPVTHLGSQEAFFNIDIESAPRYGWVYIGLLVECQWQMVGQSIVEAVGTFSDRRPVLQSGNEIPGGLAAHICAALVAVINSEFPDVGLLLVKRVVLQFKEAYDCSNKKEMEAALKFLAHLVNQAVVYELVAFDVLLLLLGRPSSDHIELAVSFALNVLVVAGIFAL
ncbi:UNVERIFIED_CONTAM: Male determiner protein Mdmd(III) [Sesamum calycinum]|uniref:Male determiner protein Mdmd(III) n=1 Tax=Sesamum calycinum TaxID=2727403 RepID=A0AAW2JE65_9LAMI